MIERYNTPEMVKIWSDQNKYETWKNTKMIANILKSESNFNSATDICKFFFFNF